MIVNLNPDCNSPGVVSVFIYSMPGYSCGIRERMLYSSCKNPLLEMVENKLQMEVEKKVSSARD